MENVINAKFSLQARKFRNFLSSFRGSKFDLIMNAIRWVTHCGRKLSNEYKIQDSRIFRISA